MKLRLFILFILALSTLLPLGGCAQLYSIFIYPIMPKPTVPAEHDLNNKTILIWVDDNDAGQSSAQVRRALTETLISELQQNKAVTQVVPYSQITAFRQQNPNLSELTIAQLGDKLQAGEVLYILINELNLYHEGGQGLFDTRVSGYCKVVSVKNSATLWPADMNYRSFDVRGQFSSQTGPAVMDTLLRELCQDTARQLSLYFYQHPR